MMSLRIREDGTIICAANSRKRKTDVYLDDAVHYALAVELGVLHYEGDNLWVFDTTRRPEWEV
jgi:hypothetical protein